MIRSTPKNVKQKMDLYFVTNGRWTKAEHELFLRSVELHGKNWAKCAELVQTRTVTQCRSHAQKVLKKIVQGLALTDRAPDKTKLRKRQQPSLLQILLANNLLGLLPKGVSPHIIDTLQFLSLQRG